MRLGKQPSLIVWESSLYLEVGLNLMIFRVYLKTEYCHIHLNLMESFLNGVMLILLVRQMKICRIGIEVSIAVGSFCDEIRKKEGIILIRP